MLAPRKALGSQPSAVTISPCLSVDSLLARKLQTLWPSTPLRTLVSAASTYLISGIAMLPPIGCSTGWSLGSLALGGCMRRPVPAAPQADGQAKASRVVSNPTATIRAPLAGETHSVASPFSVRPGNRGPSIRTIRMTFGVNVRRHSGTSGARTSHRLAGPHLHPHVSALRAARRLRRLPTQPR